MKYYNDKLVRYIRLHLVALTRYPLEVVAAQSCDGAVMSLRWCREQKQ